MYVTDRNGTVVQAVRIAGRFAVTGERASHEHDARALRPAGSVVVFDRWRRILTPREFDAEFSNGGDGAHA